MMITLGIAVRARIPQAGRTTGQGGPGSSWLAGLLTGGARAG